MKACCLSAARKTPGGFGFHRQCSRMGGGSQTWRRCLHLGKGEKKRKGETAFEVRGELQLSVWGSCSPLTLPGWAKSPLTKAIILRSDGAGEHLSAS